MRIVVNTQFNPLYNSYYYEGLKEIPNISLIHNPSSFPVFSRAGLAFLMEDGKKIYIDPFDEADFDLIAYEWCDVYGKVNLIRGDEKKKAVAIGPSFGIKSFSMIQSIYLVAKNNYSGWPLLRIKEHAANYYRQYRYQVPLSSYVSEPSERGYIFFVSTIWRKEKATNEARANFILAAKEINQMIFEGGFIRRSDNFGSEYGSIITKAERYSLKTYIIKTKKSFVVFNTPAVLNCHGWKLGEYLALGKAIISTPLLRAMPAPLEHGVHIHYVDPTVEALKKAILRLQADLKYKKSLEDNAKDYYLKYLSPKAVISRLISS